MHSQDDPIKPDFSSLKPLLLEVAQEDGTESLLNHLVGNLAQRQPVALVRIWLLEPGDICSHCAMRSRCLDKSLCLHLVASAGRSINRPDASWNRLDGDFRRIPLNLHLGRVAKTGKAATVWDISQEPDWILCPQWVEDEDIRVLVCVPLLHKNQVVGVFAIFAHRRPSDEFVDEAILWQRLAGDLATSAVAKHRAFDEIQQLNRKLQLENEYLREEISQVRAFGDIVGKSKAMQEVFKQIDSVAPTDATVLIQGESGTGKELVAHAIHEKSTRKDRPLVKVNCASVPHDLFESEFFGHAKGAFTGAIKDRIGRFQLAHGGTLFLDELGEIPLELQSKLLRVIQEGQFERIGEDTTRTVDVRIIAATNLDLAKEVVKRFREDLYFRFNVFPITIAPLRERIEDVPVLATDLLRQTCQRLRRPQIALKHKHVRQLQNYGWPGNVRELQNVIERAVIVWQGGDLHFDLASGTYGDDIRSGLRHQMVPGQTHTVLTYAELKQFERNNIVSALEEASWKIAGPDGAAAFLGVSPTTLASRMKAMGIKRP